MSTVPHKNNNQTPRPASSGQSVECSIDATVPPKQEELPHQNSPRSPLQRRMFSPKFSDSDWPPLGSACRDTSERKQPESKRQEQWTDESDLEPVKAKGESSIAFDMRMMKWEQRQRHALIPPALPRLVVDTLPPKNRLDPPTPPQGGFDHASKSTNRKCWVDRVGPDGVRSQVKAFPTAHELKQMWETGTVQDPTLFSRKPATISSPERARSPGEARQAMLAHNSDAARRVKRPSPRQGSRRQGTRQARASRYEAASVADARARELGARDAVRDALDGDVVAPPPPRVAASAILDSADAGWLDEPERVARRARTHVSVVPIGGSQWAVGLVAFRVFFLFSLFQYHPYAAAVACVCLYWVSDCFMMASRKMAAYIASGQGSFSSSMNFVFDQWPVPPAESNLLGRILSALVHFGKCWALGMWQLSGFLVSRTNALPDVPYEDLAAFSAERVMSKLCAEEPAPRDFCLNFLSLLSCSLGSPMRVTSYATDVAYTRTARQVDDRISDFSSVKMHKRAMDLVRTRITTLSPPTTRYMVYCPDVVAHVETKLSTSKVSDATDAAQNYCARKAHLNISAELFADVVNGSAQVAIMNISVARENRGLLHKACFGQQSTEPMLPAYLTFLFGVFMCCATPYSVLFAPFYEEGFKAILRSLGYSDATTLFGITEFVLKAARLVKTLQLYRLIGLVPALYMHHALLGLALKEAVIIHMMFNWSCLYYGGPVLPGNAIESARAWIASCIWPEVSTSRSWSDWVGLTEPDPTSWQKVSMLVSHIGSSFGSWMKQAEAKVSVYAEPAMSCVAHAAGTTAETAVPVISAAASTASGAASTVASGIQSGVHSAAAWIADLTAVQLAPVEPASGGLETACVLVGTLAFAAYLIRSGLAKKVPLQLLYATGYRWSDTHLPCQFPTQIKHVKHANFYDDHLPSVKQVGIGMYVKGLTPPTPDTCDPMTMLQGAYARVAKDMPSPTRSSLERIERETDDFCRRFLVPLSPSRLVETREAVIAWLESSQYNQERKNELLSVYDDYVGCLCLTVQALNCNGHGKRETYLKFKQARAILSRTDLFKTVVGPAFKLIEEAVYSHPSFIKHIPVKDRPDYIMTMFDGCPGPFFVTDYTSFESSFSPEVMQSCEVRMYNYMLQNFPRLSSLISRVLPGWNRCVFKYFTMWIPGRRMSGEMCTSLGNGFTNLILARCACKGDPEQLRIVVEGDDAIMYHPEGFDTQFFTDAGFIIKIERVSNVLMSSFCGLKMSRDMCSMTDPRKVLLNFGWTHSKFMLSRPAVKLGLLRAKAMSLLYEHPRCPILSVLAIRALELTSDIKPVFGDSWREKQKADECKLYEKWSLVENAKGISEACREAFDEEYGISRTLQVDIESYLRSADLGPLEGPWVELLFGGPDFDDVRDYHIRHVQDSMP